MLSKIAKAVIPFTVVVFAFLLSPVVHAEGPISFNLSTSRSFSPKEKPAIHLYAHNVDELEFRIYRVEDPEKFLGNLKDLHSFGNDSPWGPKEQVDEETWLERFHDWKHHLWFEIRMLFRRQFSPESRTAFRRKQSTLAKRSRIVGVAQFAQIPLLNDRKLVARWRQELPPTFVSDSQDLPIDPLPSGLYLVEATDGHYKAYTVLVVSQMALITRTSAGSVLAFAVDRESGAPISHVQVSFSFGNQQQDKKETGADGLVELHGPASKQERDNLWLLATAGKDVAIVTPASYSFTQTDSERWASFTYTDRPVYRPGHTVHWKAILRERVQDHLELPKAASIHAVISDDQDHSIFDQKLPISHDGTVTGEVTLSPNASLGYYTIRLSDGSDGSVGAGDFQVQEYKKPEYQVHVTAAKPRVMQGEAMQVVIDSRYFFGEPVPNAVVKYRVYHSRHYWWQEEEDSENSTSDGDEDSSNNNYLGYNSEEESEKTGRLDSNGKLIVTIPTQLDNTGKQHYDQDYTVEAGVTDAANREVTARGGFLATYGSFRIHVEPARYIFRTGEKALFHVTATDYDNKPVKTHVHLKLLSRHWQDGHSKTTPLADTDVDTDAVGKAEATFAVQSGGALEVEASATTPEKRQVEDSSWLYALGSGEADWGGSANNLQIVADKKSYAPGDTAHLSIISDIADFHALVVAAGYSVEFKKVLPSEGKTLSFDVPITTDSQPNLEVSVVFLKDGQLYTASKQIKVPPAQQQLQISIAPVSQVFQPQQSAVYDVYTRDSSNRPVSADLSFGVVDEALYSIYPDQSGNILRHLYPDRYASSSVDSSLTYYFSGEAGLKSPLLADRKSRYRPQLAQVKPGNDVVQPKVRKAFPDTAYWAPSVHTDGEGHARVTLTFPDSLTTWRTTVRAITADSKAGAAVNKVIVRKNLIVRMGSPRFMRKGDELTIPVIVHNYLEREKQVQISLEVAGLDTVAGAPKQISVGSRAEGTLYWRVRASQLGTARLVAKALTNEESDALEISFPVEPAGVPRRMQSSGVIADANGQSAPSVNFPGNTDVAAHSLHVEVSPSIAGSLFSALEYLTSYPYGCTEQTMSSFLPNIVVSETLKKLSPSVQLDKAELNAKIDAGIERLADYQHEDGGWGWWKEDDSRVFMTAYVVSGLAKAREAGYRKAAYHLPMGQQYLQQQLQQHPRMLPDLRAYVVYALTEAGGNVAAEEYEKLWSRRKDLSSEGLAMTGLALLKKQDGRTAEIAKLLESKAVRSGATAYWPSSYNPLLDLYYNNDAESTAFALRFLTNAAPQSPLLQEAAQWLILNRTDGYWWYSTEQTAMVLFGLVDYLAASHELNGDFVADVLVNGKPVASRHFTANDVLTGINLAVDIPADKLLPQGNSIQIVKRGQGRAYWSVQGKYYSTDKKLYQQGKLSLNLTRDYYKLVPAQKDGKIVYRLEPLRGSAAIGDVLAVHLAVAGTKAQYLLVEDPIPAGTEFVQHEDSYNIVDRPSTWQYWYTRREFHDDRAAIFATEFEGRNEAFYLLKVVNPGSFTISPAHVEPMYQPDIQATSDLLHLQVDEAK